MPGIIQNTYKRSAVHMKKLISIILSFAMIVSTFAFCLPAFAFEADQGVEATGNFAAAIEKDKAKASLAEDADFPIEFDFEDGNVSMLQNETTSTTVAKATASGNTYARIKVTSDADPKVILPIDGDFPEGRYTISYDVMPENNRGRTPTRVVSSNFNYGETSVSLVPKNSTAISAGAWTTVTKTVDLGEDTSEISLDFCMVHSNASAASSSNPHYFCLDNIKIDSVPVEAEIVFDANGGSGDGDDPITVQVGKTATLPTETSFTRQYYTFKGWARSKSATADGIITSITPAKSELDSNSRITLYAVWERNTFSVTLDADGGITSADTTYAFNEGEEGSLVLPKGSAISKDGYMFIGWTDGENTYAGGATVYVTEAKTFKAVWMSEAGFGRISPVSASGYDGKTSDVDPRFPGAYFTFEKAVNPATVTLDNLNYADAVAVDYDDETKTVIVYVAPKNLGSTISIGSFRSNIVTADGEDLLTFTALSYKLASETPDVGDDLIGLGDMESGYSPMRNSSSLYTTDVVEETDGNKAYYAYVNDGSSQVWNHNMVYMTIRPGAYKGKFKVKNLGYATGSNGEAVASDEPVRVSFSVQFTGDVADVVGHENNVDHVVCSNLSVPADNAWHEFEFEFTVTAKRAVYASEGISIYSSPSSSCDPRYAIDDLEIYRAVYSLSYVPGFYTVLKEGAATPAETAFFESDSDKAVTITSELPYEVTDSRWYIDEEKPWKDQNGNVYAAGDVVNLESSVVLEPNVKTDEEIYTVSFKGDGLVSGPDSIVVFSGESVDLSKTYDSITPEGTKRFNGWSTTGDYDDIIYDITPTEDVTLYAVVSYDFNFAIPSNYEGITYNKVDPLETFYKGNEVLLHPDTSTNMDTSIKLPLGFYASDIKAAVVRFDAEYTDEGYSNILAQGTDPDGYFSLTPAESYASSRGVKGVKQEISEDGKYVSYIFNLSTNQYWAGQIYWLRIDACDGLPGWAVRDVRFIETDVFDDDVIEITGVTAPVTGEQAVTKATVKNSNASFQSLTWKNGLSDGAFNENTVYTVEIAVSPKAGAGARFKDDVKATIDGKEAEISIDDATGNLLISYTFPKTDPYIMYSMEISGPTEITAAQRKTTYKLVFDEEETIPNHTATWSISDNTKAQIDEDTGAVVPMMNGDITITAVSNYNRKVVATYDVTIKNQVEPSTIHYDANTTDSVSNMPEDDTASGYYKISDKRPVRDGYAFLGWATSDDTLETVDILTVTKDVTLYAVWGRGYYYPFYNAEPIKFDATTTKTANYLELNNDVKTSGDMMAYVEYGTNTPIKGSDYYKVYVKMATTADDFFQIYYRFYDASAAGFNSALSESRSLKATLEGKGVDSFDTYVLDFSKIGEYVENDITALRIDPNNIYKSITRLEYILVADMKRTVSFNANTSDEVTGLPDSATATWGDTYVASATPSRKGYSFTGWSKDPDDKAGVSKTFGIVDDTVLYAIWDKDIAFESTTENGKNVAIASDSIDPADGDAIIVKAGTKEGNSITLTYTSESGDECSITAKTNANGYAIFDISEIEGEMSDVKLFATSAAVSSIVVTDADTAIATAEAVSQSSGKVNTSEGVNDTGATKHNYDSKSSVTDLTKPGKIEPSGIRFADDGEGEPYISPLSRSRGEGTILYNFDNEGDAELFKYTRQMTLGGITESVASYTSNGMISGSANSPAITSTIISLDADTHPYIVVKAKEDGFSNKGLKILFREEDGVRGRFTEDKSAVQELTDEYSMLVYDMAAVEGWSGTIEALMFSVVGDVKGDLDIDWIMFTDTVPENMDDITGTTATPRFPIVVKGAMPFTDVPESEWYAPEVTQAYKLGFVTGMSDEIYAPYGNVTVAESITLAVRLNRQYNYLEPISPAEGEEWYAPYVTEAINAGIIKSEQYTDYNANAKRKEFADMIARALPSEWYTKINMFTEVPDLAKKDLTYMSVLKLYNAGVVTGVDSDYNFLPENFISRAEAAAIINRAAIAKNRKRVVTEAEKESLKKKYYADDIVESAGLSNCTSNNLVLKDGYAYGIGKERDDGRGDPIVVLTGLLGQFDAEDVQKITISVKWNMTKIPAASELFFMTEGDSGFTAAKRIIGTQVGEVDDKGFAVFEFTTSANYLFAGRITGLRYDPFDAADEFYISSIIVE